MVSDRTRRTLRAWKGALLIMGISVITAFVPKALSGEMPSLQSLFSMSTLVVLGAGLLLTLLYAAWQTRSSEESPETIKERVSQLHSELRSQVQSRSYGARSKLIAAPLKQLDLDITPRVGLVRDPRLTEPEPISKEAADIVAAFTSSKRRLLIVGEPGAGKTTAAYALIEHLDEAEGDERVPLLVNLSAWEAQESFEAFLVDYLCSEVGYQVRQPAVARAFIQSRQYSLVLDGLDEIPAGLREHFSECLDEFARGLPGEVAVVVTCRTQEYEELFAAHPPGLGLVQAVEILPLTSQQLDAAFGQLAKLDNKDWETFLTHRHLDASQRARDLLSNPLFLNLAVGGQLPPRELLNSDQEQELRDLVLERYLDRVFGDQTIHELKDVRRYLTWIARFLNGDEVSPFGLKTTDSTVFDLADLTPADPPMRHRLFMALAAGLVGLIMGLFYGLVALVIKLVIPVNFGLGSGLGTGWVLALFYGLVVGLLAGWPFKRSAVRSRLTLVWPSTKRQLLHFLDGARRGLVFGLAFGLVMALVLALKFGLKGGLLVGLVLALLLALLLALVSGLVNPRSVLITARTPKEASSRSRVAALIWLVVGLGLGLSIGLIVGQPWRVALAEGWVVVLLALGIGMGLGMGLGLGLGLRNGGGFVLLQKIAHHRLARAGNLPPHPADFLEWGIERQIFRRVGGGVRFRHSLIQQHLVNTSVDFTEITAASRSD